MPSERILRRRRRTRTLLFVAIGILTGLLFALAIIFVRLLSPAGIDYQVGSDGLQWYRSMYGFGSAADTQLASPTSVAIAPSGRIYVTDPTRARIMVFRPDGSFSNLIHTGAGGTGRGQMLRPESIAVDENGEIYVADSQGHKIIVFGPDGKFRREWPVDLQARGVAVKDGRVVVLDVGKVIVFDTQGTRLVDFGTRGSQPGQIDAYQGVTTDGNNIYVADSYNKRVQAFSSDGDLLWVQPETPVQKGVTPGRETSAGAGPFQLPQDITMDAAGRLIVSDAFGFDLVALDAETGKVLGTYGQMGRADGQFFYPTSVAYDADRDWFVIADSGNNRAQIVTLPGSTPAPSPMAAAARGVSGPWRYGLPALAVLLFAGAAVAAVYFWNRQKNRVSTSGHTDPGSMSGNRMGAT